MARDMVLVSSLQDLEKRTLSSLDETLDYFTYSKRVWVILQKDVKKGRRFTIRSQTTKNQINEHDLLARAQVYVTGYLLSSTLQHFTSLFESYFFELLRVWLVSHPKSLSGKQVKFETVLTTNKPEIIQSVVDRELNDVKYKGIADWFEYLQRLVSLDCPAECKIEQLAEIKASRDILAHNNGIVNETYLRKAGSRARYMEGAKLEISEQYLHESWEVIRKVVQDLSSAAQMKA